MQAGREERASKPRHTAWHPLCSSIVLSWFLVLGLPPNPPSWPAFLSFLHSSTGCTHGSWWEMGLWTMTPVSKWSQQEINWKILHSHTEIKTLKEKRDMCRTDPVLKTQISMKIQGGKYTLHVNKSHEITTLIPNTLIYSTCRLVTRSRGGKRGEIVPNTSSLFTRFSKSLPTYPLLQGG